MFRTLMDKSAERESKSHLLSLLSYFNLFAYFT